MNRRIPNLARVFQAGAYGRPNVVAWSPADLETPLDVWNEAGSGVYNDAGTTLASTNDLVYQWNDLTGNGRHWQQTTSGSRLTLISESGFSLISKARSGDFMTNLSAMAWASGGSFSWAMVVKAGNQSTDTMLGIGNGAEPQYRINSPVANAMNAFSGYAWLSSASLSPAVDGWNMFTLTAGSGNGVIYQGTTSVASGAFRTDLVNANSRKWNGLSNSTSAGLFKVAAIFGRLTPFTTDEIDSLNTYSASLHA